MENIFSQVKEAVTVLEAVEYYGIGDIDKAGNILCIFHPDANPSMHIYEDTFKCFGCGKWGDVIDLVAEFFKLSKYDAAKKLGRDFGIIPYDYTPTPSGNRQKQEKPKLSHKEYKEIENRAFIDMQVKREFYRSVSRLFAPKNPEEQPSKSFLEATEKLPRIQYYLDRLSEETDENKKADIIIQFRKEERAGDI